MKFVLVEIINEATVSDKGRCKLNGHVKNKTPNWAIDIMGHKWANFDFKL